MTPLPTPPAAPPPEVAAAPLVPTAADAPAAAAAAAATEGVKKEAGGGEDEPMAVDPAVVKVEVKTEAVEVKAEPGMNEVKAENPEPPPPPPLAPTPPPPPLGKLTNQSDPILLLLTMTCQSHVVQACFPKKRCFSCSVSRAWTSTGSLTHLLSKLHGKNPSSDSSRSSASPSPSLSSSEWTASTKSSGSSSPG